MGQRLDRALAELVDQIRGGRGRMVALTGAGISVASGIPPFRGRDGLWARYDPEEFAHIQAFRRNPAKVWGMVAELVELLERAEPNPAHRALARLEERGYLRPVITQNIDGLHQAAGSRDVIELHGNFRRAACLDCGARHPMAQVAGRVRLAGAGGYRCHCGGWLKPDIVFFGEPLPEQAFLRAWVEVQKAPWLLVVGTSAEVEPAARLPVAARRAGARIVEINPVPVLGADVTLPAPAEQVLPRLAETLEQAPPSSPAGVP